MPRWQYCFVHQDMRHEGGQIVTEYFIARPDRPETRNDIQENVLLAILGGEGWELVSVVGVQSEYRDDKVSMGAGGQHPSARRGQSDVSSTMYYFKRPMAE